MKNYVCNWSYDPIEIKKIILSHFTNLYSSKTHYVPLSRPTPQNFPFIPTHIFDAISSEVTNSEIRATIFSLKPMKAQGLDNLHPIFFHKFWNIVGQLVKTHVKNVFKSKKISKDLNATLICLVPKVAKLETIQQFRSINLCNTIYKTITKIIFLRIKPYLDDLIHPFQASFIPGRKASDNIILAKEVIPTMSISNSKKGLMALKIDLEKAFDRLEWGFIKYILEFFNFPSDKIEIIMSCITTSNLSVLVNGERLNYFLPS